MWKMIIFVIVSVAIGVGLFYFFGDTLQVTSSKEIIDIKTEEQFDETIKKSSGFSLVMFYVTGKEASKVAGAAFDTIAEEKKGKIKCYSINCDKLWETAKKYEINRKQAPQFIFMRDGVRLAGPISAKTEDQIRNIIKRYLR